MTGQAATWEMNVAVHINIDNGVDVDIDVDIDIDIGINIDFDIDIDINTGSSTLSRRKWAGDSRFSWVATNRAGSCRPMGTQLSVG
jgi:hypothetical protein